MSNSPDRPTADDDSPRQEYDFSQRQGVVRGKYAKRYHERVRIVRLAEDVSSAFPDEASVNDALREYLKEHPASTS